MGNICSHTHTHKKKRKLDAKKKLQKMRPLHANDYMDHAMQAQAKNRKYLRKKIDT